MSEGFGQQADLAPSWLLVGHPDVAESDLQDLLNDALAAAPAAVRANTTELLPRRPVHDRCRICGNREKLSKEHIPPAAVGNQQRAEARGIEEWLARDSIETPPRARIEQGGIWGRVLCEACNNLTGRLYGREYQEWSQRGVGLLNQTAEREECDGLASLHELLHTQLTLRHLHARFESVRPGRFIRQVASIFASLSGDWDLAGANPAFRSMILDNIAAPLPPTLGIHLGLYLSNTAHVAGPSLVLDSKNRRWSWVSVLSFAPFVIEFTLAASHAYDGPLCSIGGLAEVDPSEVANIDLELPLTLDGTPLPTDYRSQAQVEAGLDIYGQPRDQEN